MKTLSKHWLQIILIAGPIITVAIVLAIIQPWSSTPDLNTVKARASEAAWDIRSFRMSISAAVNQSEDSLQSTFESEFVAPDSYHVKMIVGDTTKEYIVVGNKTYYKDGRISEAVIFGLTKNFSAMLNREMSLQLFDKLIDVQSMAREKIEGTDCLHYQGQMDLEKQMAEAKRNILEYYNRPGKDPPSEAELDRMVESGVSINHQVDIWIGAKDYIPRQVKQSIHGPDGNGGQINTDYIQKYYDFNQPGTIEPPLDANGHLLEGWNQADGSNN